MIFKQAFRVAFVALIWKQYKAAIVSTLLLLAYLFIVGSIHKDYLASLGPSEIDKLSFIYKWAAYVVGFATYFAFHVLRGRLKTPKETTADKINESKELTDTDQDPFAAIRDRKKLRGRGDFLIDEKKGNQK